MDKGSDAIYENVMIPSKTRPPHSDAGDERKNFSRGAAVFLGLLCLLLLAGLVVLISLFTKGNSERKMEMALLHNSYNKVTRERNDLQTGYNNLTKERDQLQNRFEDMTKERNDLQKHLQDLKQWVYFSGSFYYISSEGKSWQESRDDCLQRDAHLLIINSKEKQDFARQFKQILWIGLTDSETEGTWKWVDGSPLTTSYWDSGEPNGAPGGSDEDCAEIKYYEKEKGWNDESCEVKKKWICEKTVTL